MGDDLPFAFRALAAYAVHSTVLLLAAWGVVRVWRRVPPAAEETVWRVAWLGGILTSLLAACWPSVQVAAVATATLDVAASEAGGERIPAPPLPLLQEPRARADLGVLPGEPVDAAPVPSPDPSPASSSLGIGAALLIAYGLLAFLGILRLGIGHGRFRRRLADRTDLGEGRLRTTLDALSQGRRIGLSSSVSVAGPVAFGLRRPEIVLPARALTDLGPAEQAAMLAHEVAHLERRDPLWLALGRVLDRLLFVQPLNLLATRRLRRVAEIRCDDWAAERTGGGLALAECLARVATWARGSGVPLPASASAMAGVSADVTGRVERLLADRRERPVRRSLVFSAGVLGLGAVALLAPRVAAAPPPAAPAEAAPAQASPLALLDAEIAALEQEAAETLALALRTSSSPRTHALVARVVARIRSVQAARERLRHESPTNPGERR